MRIIPLHRILFVALGMLWAVPPNALAEDVTTFPTRSIRIVVPFAPSGAADILARTAAQFTTVETGWQFYVENISGAGGLVGAQAAARSPADGYTLLLCNVACAANQFLQHNADWNPKSAIAPLVVLGYLPNVVVVGPSVRAGTLKDFIDHARANPGRVSIATSGPGSSSSLTAELLTSKAGIQTTKIPLSWLVRGYPGPELRPGRRHGDGPSGIPAARSRRPVEGARRHLH